MVLIASRWEEQIATALESESNGRVRTSTLRGEAASHIKMPSAFNSPGLLLLKVISSRHLYKTATPLKLAPGVKGIAAAKLCAPRIPSTNVITIREFASVRVTNVTGLLKLNRKPET